MPCYLTSIPYFIRTPRMAKGKREAKEELKSALKSGRISAAKYNELARKVDICVEAAHGHTHTEQKLTA